MYAILYNLVKMSFYMKKLQVHREHNSLYGGYSNELVLHLIS